MSNHEALRAELAGSRRRFKFWLFIILFIGVAAVAAAPAFYQAVEEFVRERRHPAPQELKPQEPGLPAK